MGVFQMLDLLYGTIISMDVSMDVGASVGKLVAATVIVGVNSI
jgi:hypothetical protein